MVIQQQFNSSELAGVQDIDNVKNILKTGIKAFAINHIYPKVITLDIDANYTYDISYLTTKFGLLPKDILVTKSKSGEGYHVYIKVTQSFLDQISVKLDSYIWVSALASKCGSDPIRECLSIERVKNGIRFPYKMFETLNEFDRVIKWAKINHLTDQITEITLENLENTTCPELEDLFS